MSIISLVLITAAGCNAPAKPGPPTIVRIGAASPEAYDLLFEAVGSTLRQYYFRLDRQDRLAGIITTRPTTSANWFEWWRPQPRPAYHWAEANLQTVQRDATVHISPTDDEGVYDLSVTVNRYRHRLEERQIDNPAAAMRAFGSAAPTESGQLRTAEESSRWHSLGRDERMEQAVLNSILTRYERIASPINDTFAEAPTENPATE